MARLPSWSRFFWSALALPLLFACGGTFSTGPDSGGGPAGGSGAAGGGATAGAAGSSCAYQGKSYPDGARFPASDGCNSCACQAGSVSCTLLACTQGCQSGGQWYQPGQTFKLDCNTCTCQVDGSVSCTEAGCQDQCAALQDQYTAALKRAKACDANQPDQCTTRVPENLLCGCPTPVNENNLRALSELAELGRQASGQCIIPPCAPCPPSGPATCTKEGSLDYAPVRSQPAACRAGGVVHPHGASGIPKPGDCNTCTCDDGQLVSCTAKGCSSGQFECPTGTSAASQCFQCGPTDACQIVEHACLPTCIDGCADGACLAGICRQTCG